jgi:hypothetical protein
MLRCLRDRCKTSLTTGCRFNPNTPPILVGHGLRWDHGETRPLAWRRVPNVRPAAAKRTGKDALGPGERIKRDEPLTIYCAIRQVVAVKRKA